MTRVTHSGENEEHGNAHAVAMAMAMAHPSNQLGSEDEIGDCEGQERQSPHRKSLDPIDTASNASSLRRHVLKKSLLHAGPQDEKASLQHDGNNASIVRDELQRDNPWTPKSLSRAKSAIVYKQTLNDTLLVPQRNIFFFLDWVPQFVSLQDDWMLIYSSREKWEQGLKPDQVVELRHSMMLSDMQVEVVEDRTFEGGGHSASVRRFRRKLLDTDELDNWLNEQLRQSMVVDGGSSIDSILANNPRASARVVFEFACYNQSSFELWTKAIRRVLKAKMNDFMAAPDTVSSDIDDDCHAQREDLKQRDSRRDQSQCKWISPGHDSRVTLHQSEIWCNRVLSGEKEKAESELRRILAMEKLVSQVISPRMALLVYEKVSRVHELFVANSRREIEGIDGRDKPLSAEILNFFADHLKRKYAVFLILALTHGIPEEQIRDAHEQMCLENAAFNAGVGGGDGEQSRNSAAYGFLDEESVELYEKYRDAAVNYYRLNYGDSHAAEEEDAIMHLPVMLHVAIVRRDEEEASAMMTILETVKARLMESCDQDEV